MQDKCNDQLKDGCPFKDKLNEYFGKYRISLCASRHNYTKEEFNIRYCTLTDLEKCVDNAYTDLIYKGSTPDFVSIWKDYLEGSKNEHITPSKYENKSENIPFTSQSCPTCGHSVWGYENGKIVCCVCGHTMADMRKEAENDN